MTVAYKEGLVKCLKRPKMSGWGVSQILTVLKKGGGGIYQMLIIADRGGRGGPDPPNMADIICEKSLIGTI